jgi:enoyl-CoA hydratase
MQFQYLLADSADGVYTVTLNRPDKLNAWNEAMREEMRRLMRSVQGDPDTRALIITGAGRAFSAGEDVSEMRSRAEQNVTTREFRVIARNIHNFLDDLESIELPVIAAINGICAGGGLELALSCDFRIAAKSARFGFPELRVGLIPGSGGCSRLVKAVGLLRAKELVMQGTMFDSAVAERYGLVTELVPDGEVVPRAQALARELAQRAPLALGIAKIILQNCANSDLETSRHLERLGSSILMETQDHQEAVRAFLEKRQPKFKGR